MYKKCAERDGKIDCGEKVGMAVNSFASGVMGIVDFAMLIWGSVVVFGAWANWTDNFEDFKDDPEKFNFCERTPMMTAFVILILKWVICPQDKVFGLILMMMSLQVLIPVMIAIACCCGCLCACCCGMCGAKSNQQNQS